MEIDKRSFYVWMVVLLANIGVVLAIVLLNISDYNSLFESSDLIPLGISLFMSIVPVLISISKGRLKNRFGYGIPVLLLLPLPYFIYDYYTCTGNFCLVPIFLGWSFGISAVFFAIFYTMGIYARKWTIKFILSLIWIEVILLILLIGSALYFGFNSFSFNSFRL